jgi:membrane protein implicated in regulation of membrane protease activity
MNKLELQSLLLLAMAVSSGSAAAYVGPGAGLSLLGALWGLLIALAAALFFVVMWPVRRYLKRRARAGSNPPVLRMQTGEEAQPSPADRLRQSSRDASG